MEKSLPANPPTYFDLVHNFKHSKFSHKGRVVHFHGIGDKDIYNLTLINNLGELIIAARVESHESFWLDPEIYDPQVILFRRNDLGHWEKIPDAPVFNLMEDPFSAWVCDENDKKILVFGGVFLDRATDPPTIVTKFFKGTDIFHLEPEPFAEIHGMKDIRMSDCLNGKKIVTVRPKESIGSLGKIGILTINDLSELNDEKVAQAKIIPNQIDSSSWLGSNELHIIHKEDKDYVGILGHIAHLDELGNLHYAAMSCIIDPEDTENSPQLIPRVIATRQNFEDDEAKAPNIKDVVFPGGIEHWDNGLWKLYVGLSDSRVGVILVHNPF